MKNKEIKNFIKEKANNIKINDYSENILNNVSDVNNTNNSKINKRAIFIPSSIAFAFLSIILVVILFNPFSNNINNNFSHISKAKQILGFEVVALANTIPHSTSLKMSKNNVNEDEANKICDEIHNYLLTGEMMLNKDNVSIVDNINSNQEYDYEKVLTISYNNANNYVMYYTETAINEYNKDIDEVNSSLVGLLIYDNNSYKIIGEKEVEKDEYSTSLTVFTSSNNKVVINMETEKNENEYSYSFYSNNQLIKEISLEYEEKFSKKTMSIEIKTINDNIENEKEFQFVYKNDYIICEYESESNENEEKYEVKIQYDDYNYYYIFSDEIKIKKNK